MNEEYYTLLQFSINFFLFLLSYLPCHLYLVHLKIHRVGINLNQTSFLTKEEASYAGGLSPRERIQELELTVSDQQVALQKLTLENKELGDRECNACKLSAVYITSLLLCISFNCCSTKCKKKSQYHCFSSGARRNSD